MIALLTAVSAPLEAGVATRIEAQHALRLVRRCADVADLLAAAAAQVAQAAVVSADLPGLERGVIGTLAADGLRVVGVFVPGDEESQRRLRQLGVDRLVSTAATAEEWASLADGLTHDPTNSPAPAPGGRPGTDAEVDAAITRELLASPSTPRRDAGEPQLTDPEDTSAAAPSCSVVAVWGPIGSPGRTTVAVNLAAELARLGRSVLLIDADTYGASVAQTLALLDEAPGLAAATRLAETGELDLPHLAQVAPEALTGVRVLTGLPRADRWSEIREEAFQEVLDQARLLVDVVVVDTGFCLEEDEELSYDTRAPRRNVTTSTALRAADTVLAVGAGDPVGLQRLVRGLDELARIARPSRVVVNRVRTSAVGSGPEHRVVETLERFAGVEDPVVVPDDRAALDAAMLAGRVLAESAPGSQARWAIAELAGVVSGVEVVLRRRGVRRRLSRSSTG